MHGTSVIVTGAASGIGRAIAQRLVDAGADVLAVDLEPDDDGPGVAHAADLTTREGNRDHRRAARRQAPARARGGRRARRVPPRPRRPRLHGRGGADRPGLDGTLTAAR